MNTQSEITVDMQLSDIVEAIFEYLYHHGTDGRGCPCEFIMTRKNDEGVKEEMGLFSISNCVSPL